MNPPNIQYGRYRHHKNGKEYNVISIVRHSETLEEMVVYQALFDCEQFGKNQLWTRPKEMFFENVEHDGKVVPRFSYIGG